MAKKETSPAKWKFRVRLHQTINMNIDVEAKDEQDAWEIATESDRAKWNQERSEEECDGVTQLTKECSCGRTTEWQDVGESFICDHCHPGRPEKTPWIAEAGSNGLYRVVNSDSVVLAETCAKEEAQLFAVAPRLLAACEGQLENWQSLLDEEWDGSAPGIESAIASLRAVINQAYGK
jgi:hypothetical protein